MELSVHGPIRLRSWRTGDVPALARIADNPRIAANLRDQFPHPYTELHARAYVDTVLEGTADVHLAITEEDVPIGGIGLHRQGDVHRLDAEIGFYVAESHWGQGIATAAVRALTRWAFAETDLVRIHASVFANNPASVRVLEKAGFCIEGRLRRSVIKDGRILDSILLALLRDA